VKQRILISLIAFAVMLAVYDRGITLLDEGFTVHASERIADGQLPYRDFFTLVTPGSFVIHAALFRTFGKSLLVGRWLAVLLGTLIPMLIYQLARRLAAPWFAFGATLVSIAWGVSESFWPVYANYAWFACLFVLASCDLACGGRLSLEAGREGPGRAMFAGAGAFAGLALAFKQNTGLYALAALTACVTLAPGRRWRHRVAVVALVWGAATLVNIPWLAWIAAGGGWDAMVTDLVLTPLRRFRADASAPYPQAWPLWPSLGGSDASTWSQAIVVAGRRLIAWMPLLYVASAVTLARRTLLDRDPTIGSHATVLLFGCATFLTVFPRADLLHLLFAVPLGFSLSAPLLEAAWLKRGGRLGQSLTWMKRGLIGLAMGVLLVGQVADGMRNYANTSRLDRPRAGVRVAPEDGAGIEAVLDMIQSRTRAADPILVVPWAAMFYFLSERHNPTAYDMLIVANIDAAGEARMLEQLNAAPPRLVVRGYEWDVNGQPLEVCVPRVAAWIAAHYRSVRRQGAYEVFEPSP